VETIEVMRPVAEYGARQHFMVSFHHVDGIELDGRFTGRREPLHIPIMIGATGDQ